MEHTCGDDVSAACAQEHCDCDMHAIHACGSVGQSLPRGGSLADVNWLLARAYVVLAKDYSSMWSARLADSVTTWYPDLNVAGREIGWVTASPEGYMRAVRRVAVRCRKAKGQWGYGVLIGPVDLTPLVTLLSQASSPPTDEAGRLLAYVHAYDAHGGGVTPGGKLIFHIFGGLAEFERDLIRERTKA